MFNPESFTKLDQLNEVFSKYKILAWCIDPFVNITALGDNLPTINFALFWEPNGYVFKFQAVCLLLLSEIL